MPRTIPFLIVLAALLAACAGRSGWYKDGMTEAEFKRDKEECLAEAHSVMRLLNPQFDRPSRSLSTRFDGDAAELARREAELFAQCMRNRNYRRVRRSGDDSGA